MENAPDEREAEPVTVRCLMEVSDLLASRRLFWPRAYWFDRAWIAVLAGAGVTSELLFGPDPVFWVGFYVLAGLSAIRLFILVPRAVATSERSVIGKINVVRLDEDGVHDDLGGIHNFIEWKMLTEVCENAATIGIRQDLRGGYAMRICDTEARVREPGGLRGLRRLCACPHHATARRTAVQSSSRSAWPPLNASQRARMTSQ